MGLCPPLEINEPPRKTMSLDSKYDARWPKELTITIACELEELLSSNRDGI